MKILILGIIIFIIGAMGWVVAVVLSVITGGAFKILVNIFGWIMVLSLPVAIIWVIIKKTRR
ncbi:MAG: hypothetical protein A3I24_02490 [Candidatus Harrisonbacteria bacterium RIFCSPLOWO2_02_FULL_41_13b]|uniref:Major facilitator superfamily (MFS) profile domain-containing protein n=1 Tax=Candidatus Harrisonbacteria bacterium RIFCSPLOWO2_02_FULL_41_13b TaxID=1798409 RepID=A0A1G1ZUI5_9BACT|nr:MAG: hypothetical protein A3J53_02455 [Candidatus Harrisonbacteria bacterium RIFCSPHIGHO2_02_FULL_40_20]OGY68115.1 MAG: hypothetical protein A3I24_02490 [Candidatus Harrisonbacteria bacterium RIFCSPLOWO2_02_FULL_41_13b]